MVTQYSLDSYDRMCAVANGAYVSVYDYDDLKERHDAFMRDVQAALDDLLIADAPTPIKNLEAAFMAEAHPRD